MVTTLPLPGQCARCYAESATDPCQTCIEQEQEQERAVAEHEREAAERWQAYQREVRRDYKKRKFDELVRDGLLRENFREAGFRNSKPEIEALNPDAWAKAREWPVSQNLYLTGPCGCGKSFLASSVLYEAFLKDMSVAEVNARRFTKTADLFKEGEGIMNKWKAADFLLIDDLDKSDWNQSRLTALWDLLDHRWSNASRVEVDMSIEERLDLLHKGRPIEYTLVPKRTIITSNLNPKELRELFRQSCVKGDLSNTSLPDATLDRLKPCTTLEMKGKSLR